MKKKKKPFDPLFAADWELKVQKAKNKNADGRRKWLADHIIDTLALIVAIIALIRTF